MFFDKNKNASIRCDFGQKGYVPTYFLTFRMIKIKYAQKNCIGQLVQKQNVHLMQFLLHVIVFKIKINT